MCAVHTYLGAGVSYNIIDLDIKMISVVRWMVSSKFKSLEDSTRDRNPQRSSEVLKYFLDHF